MKRIAAIVLAAGAASRFGSPKQLLKIEGETLLDRICRVGLEAGCAPVLRVLGANAAAILKQPSPAGVGTVLHPDWKNGMGSSIAAGVRALLEKPDPPDALFLLLPDQPRVSPALLREMQAKLEEPEISMVLCRHQALTGPPALFAAAHFPELLALEGDRGAKVVATRHPQRLATVDFADLALDIDTPETWQRFRARDAS